VGRLAPVDPTIFPSIRCFLNDDARWERRSRDMTSLESQSDVINADSSPLLADLDPTLVIAARRLLQRYTDVLETLRRERSDLDDGSPSQYSNHLVEDASDAQAWQSQAMLIHHLQTELQQIEHAYARLQHGVYGQCEHCGHPIPPRRLEILPSASRCVRCQEITDMRQ
jgi:DnaK suppressor protein